MTADQDACSITYEQYNSDKFIIGIMFEKMNSENLTGVNTKMSGLLTTKVRPYKSLTQNETIQEIFAHLISESLFWKLEVTEALFMISFKFIILNISK